MMPGIGIRVSTNVQDDDRLAEGKHPSPSIFPPYHTEGMNTLSGESPLNGKRSDTAHEESRSERILRRRPSGSAFASSAIPSLWTEQLSMIDS